MKKKLKKAYGTAKAVVKQYGTKGLIKAVNNKINGRLLLAGIENDAVLEQTIQDNAYALWRKQQVELTTDEQKERIVEFRVTPLVSVVMPIYNAPIKWFKLAVESLQKQSYVHWELIAIDDGSKDKRATSYLVEMGKTDERIRVIRTEQNGGISKASNRAIQEATGEYIALMDQDDALSPDALFWMVEAINRHPEADCFYSDECKIQETVETTPRDYILKPDWSPDLLYNCMYTGHLSVYRMSKVKQIGGFRSEYDFSQDYDLALRMAEHTTSFVHVKRFLYYWRMLPTSGAAGGKDYARISNLKALSDAFARRGITGKAEMNPIANRFHVIRETNPLVSIVIPSDSTDMLCRCIDKLVGEETGYQNIEVIFVANTKTCEEVEKYYQYLDCVRAVNYDKVYNFSDKCNAGVQEAHGEYVIIYNDDVYPKSRNWIENLLEVMQYPGVGGASPMTVYENGTIQYAGMITSVPNLVGTAFNGMPEDSIETGAFNHHLLRDVSVLCGACMIMRTDLYREIGGFDAVHTPIGHSDVDISFRIMERGMRCVYTPMVKLVHIGNHSWTNKKSVDKSTIYCLKRWSNYVSYDPYFPETLKTVFYRDVIHRYEIHVPPQMNNSLGKDILLVTHELTRTGAPIVLKNAVKYFLDQGDWPVVTSPVDGPLRQEFLDMGIPVIIDEGIVNGHWTFEHFARNFDLVVVNTIAVSQAIHTLSNSLPPVIWWIHEGKTAFEVFKSLLPRKVGKNIHTYAVSEYAQQVMKKYNLKADGQLMFGVQDLKNQVQLEVKSKKQFVVIGTIETRKGQDLAIQAFNLLPQEERKNARLLIIGKNANQELMEYIRQQCKANDAIEYMDAIPFQEVLKQYAESCALLVPSRDDSVSATAAEAMSLSLPCIASDQTGVSAYIRDGESGYVFPSGDVKTLSEKMLQILRNPEKADIIGKNGRKVYEKEFTYEIFERNLSRVAEYAISENKKRLQPSENFKDI